MTDSHSAIRARQYYQQGVAFYQRGQFSEAVEALRMALRHAPDHIEARIELGTVLLCRGKADDGLNVLNAGLARPNLTQKQRIALYQQAASCAASSNKYDLARSYLEQAIDAGGRPDVYLLNQVAAVCCKGGEFNVGFDYFLKATELLEES